MGNIYYYYALDLASGDYYYGYGYDNTYGYSIGYSTTTSNENGSNWYYYVYDVAADSSAAANDGLTYVYHYYDAETGQTDVPYYYENGIYSGYNGIDGGLEEWVDFGDGTYDYFSNYFVADDEFSGYGQIYYYYAVDQATGDYYYGYGYDNTYGYSIGYSTTTSNENGSNWYYYVYDVAADSSAAANDGLTYVYHYYDAETGLTDVPFFYENGIYSGDNGINSGLLDLVNFDGGTYDYFTNYLVADYVAGSGQVYYYYAVEEASGDYYYGIGYDYTYGYSIGYTTSTASENGSVWNYYVYDVAPDGLAAALDGFTFVYYYYDAETGLSDVPYFFENEIYSGDGGIASGMYELVDFDNDGVYDVFTNYYEADV